MRRFENEGGAVEMERWTGFGRAIAGRMPVLVPVCVALGVLFPRIFGAAGPFIPAIFGFMTFQGSLNNSLGQVVEAFRHPADLIAIVAISLVLMPLGAFALASALFAGNVHLITGIVLEYSVPVGIVSFMWVGIYGGNGPLALATILATTLISPFSIPLTLSALLGQAVAVDAAGMMREMLFMIALPALAGMVLNEATRGWARERLSPAISPACRALMLLVITANSTAMSEHVLHMTWERAEVALFILLFASSGFVWGFLAARLLGRPLPTLVTMSFDCGLRNISSGAVIATRYFPGEVVFPVMCGTIFQQVLASVAGRAMLRLGQGEPRPGGADPRPGPSAGRVAGSGRTGRSADHAIEPQVDLEDVHDLLAHDAQDPMAGRCVDDG